MTKLLNRIGLYTAKQMREIEFYVDAVEERIKRYIAKCGELERENEKLKLKIAKSKQNRRKERR